jgi:hypothetical protein
MNNPIFYRNENGIWEKREFGSHVSGEYWDRQSEGGIQLKEFADGALGLLRIADPIQTDLVQGYKLPETIGDKLLTPVKVEKESGRFPAFGKEALFIPGNLKRGLGDVVQRVPVQNGYVQISLSEYALGVGIENRERNESAISFDMLLTSKLNVVNGRVARYRELAQAKLITTYTNYPSGNYSSGAAKKWATTGTPIADMRALVLQIRKTTGQRPNKAWFTPTSWELLINNADTKMTLKGLVNFGSLEGGMVTPAMVAAALQIDEVLIGYATYATDTSSTQTSGAPGQASPTDGYIWEAVNSTAAGVLVVGTGRGIETAFGYTWERKNSPIVESYYDNATKSQIWDYEHFFDPAITLSNAGAMYYSLA